MTQNTRTHNREHMPALAEEMDHGTLGQLMETFGARLAEAEDYTTGYRVDRQNPRAYRPEEGGHG